MTIEVTCGRCGHTFPTAAVTATRCRQCRHSVRIGSRPGGSRSPAQGEYPVTGDADVVQVNYVNLAVMAICLAWVASGLWKRWRKWRDGKPDSGEVGP